MTKIQTPQRPPGPSATTGELARWINDVYPALYEVFRMLNGGEESTARMAADRVRLYASDGSLLPALTPGGTAATYQGDILSGADLILPGGAYRWPMGVEPDVYYLADGDSVDYEADFGLPSSIAIDNDGLDLPDYASGESFDLSVTNADATGFTLSAKIATLGTPTTVTETTNATTPTGPTHMVAKADANTAINGSYTFRITGTITISYYETEYYPGFFAAYYYGYMAFRSWFHDGASWVEGPNIIYDSDNEFGSSGAQAFDKTFVVSYSGTVRDDATLGGFGVSLLGSGGTLSDLASVAYQKRTAGSPRTASPNGERCRVSVFPRNSPQT